MKKLRLNFLEREFFAEDRTGTTVKGYEPAVMNIDGEIKTGRIIDLKRLEEAESIRTLMFQTEIGLEEGEVDLEQLLKEYEGGKKWLESLQKYFSEFFGKPVPMTFSMRPLRLPGYLKYSLMPKDYFERTRDKWGNLKHYENPKGVIKKLPETLVYWRIEPPMKFEDGTWLRGVNYSRNVQGPKGIFESYANKDPNDKEHFYAEGVLLGSLGKEDLEDARGDFENDFPLEHFLDMVYCAPIRHADRYNPMTIRTELC